jgi:hypothetical protein
MSYLILYGLFALWVLFDGLGRKIGASAISWTVGTCFFRANHSAHLSSFPAIETG